MVPKVFRDRKGGKGRVARWVTEVLVWFVEDFGIDPSGRDQIARLEELVFVLDSEDNDRRGLSVS